jgi:hypothetical protein
LALGFPAERDRNFFEGLEVEVMRLTALEDRLLDIGREEGEPQDRSLV